jgi:hypothetical protein
VIPFVKAVVIPIGVVIAAPTARILHAIAITLNFPTPLAMTSNVAIKFGACFFEPLVAVARPIPVRSRRHGGRCKQYAAAECSGENDATEKLPS